MPLSARSRSPTSPISTSGEHSPLTSLHPTRHFRSSSNDSTGSLRNLELTDGPMLTPTNARPRSFSFSGFDFQADLLPLSTTINEADMSFRESPGAEKSISLVHGTCPLSPFAFRCYWTVECQVSASSLDCRCVKTSWLVRFDSWE